MNYFRTVAAGLLAAFGMTGAASAIPIAGSDSVIVGSVGTAPSTDLLTAVSNGGTVTLSSLLWGNGSGDFTNIPFLTPIGATSLTLTNAGLASFSFTSADGTFTASPSITVGPNTFTPQFTGTSGSVAGGSETVGLYMVGTFVPAGSTGAFDPDNTSIALTLNENGITEASLGSFSGSFTVAAPAATPPAPPPVPEPVSILLLGSGLIGLAGVRRR